MAPVVSRTSCALAFLLLILGAQQGWAESSLIVDLYWQIHPDGHVYTSAVWSDGTYTLALREYPEMRPDGEAVYVWLWDTGIYSVAVREYPETGTDGGVRLVRQWENGTFTVTGLSWGARDGTARATSSLTLGDGYRGLAPDGEAETAMLELVNAERAKAGLAGLELDGRLRELARSYGSELAQLGHLDHAAESRSPFERLGLAGIAYTLAGENLAAAPDVHQAHRALMSSPTHRANILDPQFGRIGVGAIAGGPAGIFVQVFAD